MSGTLQPQQSTPLRCRQHATTDRRPHVAYTRATTSGQRRRYAHTRETGACECGRVTCSDHRDEERVHHDARGAILDEEPSLKGRLVLMPQRRHSASAGGTPVAERAIPT
jgi:hypothetical protein